MEKQDEITLVEIPSQNVLGIRKKGHYRDIAVLLPKLFEYVFSRGIGIAGMPMFLCHETGKEEAIAADAAGTADIEVAVPVIETLKGAETSGVIRFPVERWPARSTGVRTRRANRHTRILRMDMRTQPEDHGTDPRALS